MSRYETDIQKARNDKTFQMRSVSDTEVYKRNTMQASTWGVWSEESEMAFHWKVTTFELSKNCMENMIAWQSGLPWSVLAHIRQQLSMDPVMPTTNNNSFRRKLEDS